MPKDLFKYQLTNHYKHLWKLQEVIKTIEDMDGDSKGYKIKRRRKDGKYAIWTKGKLKDIEDRKCKPIMTLFDAWKVVELVKNNP